jgi:threonine dehydrogenase-like Zn-dependent dehydrogenase
VGKTAVRQRRSLYFVAPRQVEVREERLGEPGPGQATVKTLRSGISSGTEALIYRGLFPDDLAVDENIAALRGRFEYPLKYGYCAAGQVIAVGAGVDASWEGRQVFAFHPHESYFNTAIEALFPLPVDVGLEEAIFFPNMETALNLVMDGRPMIGEQVAVLGEGIIGLLSTALLARFPLQKLVAMDLFKLRRQAALDCGATACLDPGAEDFHAQLQAHLPGGADLSFEISGSPAALDEAIALTGFAGRVVIGSWYGSKQANLHLGGRFHRSRIQLISSQVSTLAPELSGRWDKMRRFELAWEMLRQVRPGRFISHHFPIEQAQLAYQLIDEHPERSIQVILEYDQGD